MNRILVWAIAASLLSGCGPEEVLGRVRAVEAPDSIDTGERFTVTVTTSGPDGCWKKERTEVSVSGLTAMIAPYDVDTARPGISCTTAVVEIMHTAEVTFARAGAGLIRVRGRDGTDKELSVVVQ